MPAKKKTTNKPGKQKFIEPPVSDNERVKKKLVVLGILTTVVILLIWFFTLPFNYDHRTGEDKANPKGFFGTIKEQISIGGGRMGEYVEDLSEAPRIK